MMNLLRISFAFFLITTVIGCSGGHQAKGYDYKSHQRNNSELGKEAQKRNKKSKGDWTKYKGKSVRRPKPSTNE
jgi:hypothetical protein